MTKNDLKDLLKDNSSEERHKIDAAATVNIGRFAFVSLQMDNKTLDYYYEIDIDELLNSEMPKEEYEVLRDQGWSIKGNKLILFLNN